VQAPDYILAFLRLGFCLAPTKSTSVFCAFLRPNASTSCRTLSFASTHLKGEAMKKTLFSIVLMVFFTGFSAHADDAVLQWNQILFQILRIPGAQPPTIATTRSFAIMHTSIYDAINSIERTHQRYRIPFWGPRYASPEAAAVAAAHTALVNLYPRQKEMLDLRFQESLAEIPDGLPKRQGIRVGEAVAQLILAWRSTDGWNAVPPSYTLAPEPGLWQPTPPAFSAATFTHYPNVVPFAIRSKTQFLPPAPPALTSLEYSTDFHEVKEIGAVNSATRTEDQTLVARLWAAANTPTGSGQIWNNVARTVALMRGNTLAENARLFALLSIVQHDGLQTSYTSKFHYGLWRPVTAIQRADEDENSSTVADPDWLPLLVTPPYPTYAGNAATIGATAATILAAFFGSNEISFEAHWEGSPGWTRWYESFWALADEQARSRIYGGIHFSIDSLAGQEIGRKLSKYVFRNFLTPRKRTR
jgi:hypothetical protein